MLGIRDNINHNMRKEKLIKQLQERAPLLANAVSHMVTYVQDRYPSTFPSKEQTETVNNYLRSVNVDGEEVHQNGIVNTAVSLHRTLPLPPSVY